MEFIEEDNGLITSRWDEEGAWISELYVEYHWLCRTEFCCAEINERRREVLSHIHLITHGEVTK